MAILISAHSLNSRFTQLALSVLLLLGAVYVFTSALGSRPYIPGPGAHSSGSHKLSTPPSRPRGNHPIDKLVRDAEKEFESLLSKETHNVKDAAKAYRKRRGRQPPPAFDQWFHFAQKQGSIVVEEFFDRIYDDLTPFWGASPNQLRNHANSAEDRVSVREQTVTLRAQEDFSKEQADTWRTMIEEIIARDGWVPDVDLPVNLMDETRIIAKWEDIREHMMREAEGRQIVPEAQLINSYQRLEFLDKLAPGAIDPVWHVELPYWNIVTPGCPPMSPARHSYLDDHDYTHPPVYDQGFPDGSHYGFVSNWTLSRSLCDYPNLQSLTGSFIEPVSVSVTQKLIPMFHSAKLSVNNDIILPSPLHWRDEKPFSKGEDNPIPWEEKEVKVFWRGDATGGRNRDFTWTHWHRHRFARMANGSAVREASNGEEQPNFMLPDNNYYDLNVLKGRSEKDTLGNWIEKWSDVGLTHLHCFPDEDAPRCGYTDPYYLVVDGTDGINRGWHYRYLPDIDGNTNSARFRMYLNSTSLPIKATMYHEWHDNRLVPWKHFVPMHNTYMDFYGIMDYFVGNNDGTGYPGHDNVAKAIAYSGQEWTERALRKEDMLVYMYRVLLEFARLCHDNRYKMGWSDNVS